MQHEIVQVIRLVFSFFKRFKVFFNQFYTEIGFTVYSSNGNDEVKWV